MSELTEENLKKMFDEAGKAGNPDTFMISSKNLKELKRLGLVKYDPIKCSWQLLEEAYTTPPKTNVKENN